MDIRARLVEVLSGRPFDDYILELQRCFVHLLPFDGVGLHRSFREAVYGPTR